MAMLAVATLAGNHNLFSNLPTTAAGTPPSPPSNGRHHSSSPPAPQPPIPIPKYPPPSKSRKWENQGRKPPKSQENPALKTHHHNSKYYKPVKQGQIIPAEGDRSIVVGDNGVSYRLPGAPFEFQFSYSETPKAKPLAMREPAFLPFAPPTMPRPWTGKAPLKKSKRKIKLFEPLVGPGKRGNGADDEEMKRFEMLKAYELGRYTSRSREEVLGRPLTRAEIRELLKPCISSNRQVNLGRDGLTHNMLELVHTHWRRQPVCKVRCLGVPTVDMDNICSCLEEKLGGKIIHRVGGMVYIFRGRNYDHRTRPKYPVMLWKPATPVYPKLIQEAPEGLTKEEADDLRMKGKNLLPICKLAKNGVYVFLVRDVRNAFEGCPLVKIDCKGMHASDYKKIGAKLKELVPCILLSFDDEQILMWRGKDWKSNYRSDPATINPAYQDISVSGSSSSDTQKSDAKIEKSSPRMMSFWESAIDSGKALLLDKIDLDPEELLEKVKEFESISQVEEHSYPALVMSRQDSLHLTQHNSDTDNTDCSEPDEDFDDESDLSDSFEEIESSIPLGSLPIDSIVKQLSDIED